MFAALIDHLDAECGTLFGASAETPKFFLSVAPPTPLPYAVLVDAGSVSDFESGGGRIDLGTVQISIFAATKAGARTLGKAVKESVDDAELSPVSGGTLLELRHIKSYWQPQPDSGPQSPHVFQRIVEFVYRIQR